MVARVSEYLYTSKSEHWLTTERVQFEMPDGTLVPAQSAHKHVHAHPMAVHIHIKTYIRENSHMFQKARAALAGSEAMTLSDVKRLDTANTAKSSANTLPRV